MKKLLICCVMAVFAAGCSVKLKNVMIDSGHALFGPEEPSICVSPYSTKYMVAGANIRNVYYSDDWGHSWEKQTLKSPHGVYGDPCILADKKGNFYFLHLSDPEHKGWASDSLLDRIVCQRSEDKGKTWNEGGHMGLDPPKDQDKEWAVINHENGEIYATWTQFDKYNSKEPGDSSNIMFSKSADGGDTWSPALRINKKAGNCLDNDSTTEGAVPAVGPKGEIYVAWANEDKIYFDKSLDGGKTWLDNDKVAANIAGGWVIEIPGVNRCNGMPVTMCDLSGGPGHGNIYINWCDTTNGAHDVDVWFIKSKDGGESWTKPKRVNDDPAGKQQFLTWMAVDQVTGRIYIVYYDRRHHDDNHTDVYLGYSADQGETFHNVMVSDSSFMCNDVVFFGDYNNISAHDDFIRPIWTRLDQNKISIWTALIKAKQLDKIIERREQENK